MDRGPWQATVHGVAKSLTNKLKTFKMVQIPCPQKILKKKKSGPDSMLPTKGIQTARGSTQDGLVKTVLRGH